MDATPVITLDQLAGISIEEFLGRALQEGTLTVQFPDGEAVTIQPKPKLQPLPVKAMCQKVGKMRFTHEYNRLGVFRCQSLRGCFKSSR